MSCHSTCGSVAVRCRALVQGACADGRAPDALARLVEQTWPEVRALVRRTGARGEDADDLTQAYFARFLEKDYLRQLQTWEGCIRPFLVTSLRHFLSNARDHARAQKRGGRLRTLSLEEALACNRAGAALVSASTPESLLASAERQRALRRAIDALKDETRCHAQRRRLEALLGHLHGGSADSRDLARQWGVSPGAVRVAVHRLRRRLARALGQDGSPPAVARPSAS